MYKDYVKQNHKWDELADKASKLQSLASQYALMAKEAKKELVELSGEQNSMGNQYVLKAEHRKGPVEYTRIPELKFVDLDEYRKQPVTTWKLSVVKTDIAEIVDSTTYKL